MKTVALCITHAAHVPARKKSMERLRAQLRLGDILDVDSDDGRTIGSVVVPNFGRIPYREETIRAPHHVWSRRQWDWGAEQTVDLVLFLQDDALVAPDFWQRLESVLYAPHFAEHGWLNLLTNHHGARAAFMEGFAAYSTPDGVNGVAYGASPNALGLLGEWVDLRTMPGIAEKVSDDVLVSLFCMATNRQVLTPLPGLVDHDLGVGTLHPREHGANRRAYVRWDDDDRGPVVWDVAFDGASPETHLEQNRQANKLKGLGEVARLGRYYATAHTMLPGVLLDAAEGLRLATALEKDSCPWPYNRFFEQIIAQETWP